MNNRYLLTLILTLTLLATGACQKGPATKESLSSRDPQTKALKLKEGVKIRLEHRDIEKQSPKFGKRVTREVILDVPGGAQGVALVWREASEEPETAPMPQGKVITLETDATGKATNAHLLPNPLKRLLNTEGGHLSLPNLTHARRMTLPVFWPHGDLYLSDSSGIWLSDVAFEEIKKDGKTNWNAGLLDNPLLGPAENLKALRLALVYLEDGLREQIKKKKQSAQIHEDGTGKFTLEIDGRPQEVEVVEVGNWLARYQILDNAQNPLILSIEVAPGAKIAELLFSPLGIIKGLVEYQVTAFNNPKPKVDEAL